MRRFIQDKGRTAKPLVWEVTVIKNNVCIMWGQLGGAMQTTTQTFKAVNVGKANEKSKEVVAQEWADRQILGRTRKGHVEVDLKTNKPLNEEKVARSIEDFGALPKNLRFFKPQQNLNAHCSKLIDSGDAICLRKRDGMMHVIAFDDVGIPTLYGANLLQHHKDEPGISWLTRYPHIGKELLKLGIPPNTILLGEIATIGGNFVNSEGCDEDDFEHVESVIKSKLQLALEKQEEGGALGFCIWDIAFWDGECLLQEMRAEDRFNIIFGIVLDDDGAPRYEHITAPELVTGVHIKTLLQMAKDNGWEGWVIVDPDATYGDRSYNFRGKPDRPKFACKLKPKYEADFIVRWDPDNGIGRYGKGKKYNGVGSVQAYLWDPVKKEEREISLVGGGLEDTDVVRFADPSLYPMVWHVKFDSWTRKGSLRFSSFLRERTDKTLKECTIDQNPAWVTE